MKVAVAANALVKAADASSAIAFGGRRLTGQQKQVLSLNAEASQLVVAAVTNTYAVTTRVKCIETPTPGTSFVTVSADELNAALGRFSSWATVDLSLAHGSSLLIAGASETVLIPIRGVGKSIPSDPSDDPRIVTIGAADLLDLADVTRLICAEKFRLELMQWVVHLSECGATSVCGDGGIFAAIERRDMQAFSSSGEWTFTVNTAQVPPLRRLLSRSDDATVLIRDWDGDEIAVITVGDVRLDLFAAERLPYPDARTFIERNYRSRFVIEAAEIARAAKCMERSELPSHRRTNKPHWTSVIIGDGGASVMLSALDESGVSCCAEVFASEGFAASDLSTSLSTNLIDMIARLGKAYGYAEVEMIDNRKPLVIRFSNEPRLRGGCWVRDAKLGGLRRTSVFVGVKPSKRDTSKPPHKT